MGRNKKLIPRKTRTPESDNAWVMFLLFNKPEYLMAKMRNLELRLSAMKGKRRTVMEERDRAYAELRKQAPCVNAVFDREVWEKAKQAEAAP